MKTIQEENNKKVERAEEKESKLIFDFNEKVNAKDEIIVKYQAKVESLDDMKTKLITEKEQKNQVIENLEKKHEKHLLEEEKDKINLRATINELKEENDSLKGDIRYTSAENEKSLKEQNKIKSELAIKSSTINSLERDKRELEGNYTRQAQKYEAEKRLESGEMSMLKTQLETKTREMEQKDEQMKKLKQDYEVKIAEKMKELDKTVKAMAELSANKTNSASVSTAPSTAPKLKIKSFESLSAQPSSAAPDILQNIMPSPLSSLTDLPFQAKRTGVVAPLPQTSETLTIPKAQVLPINRGRDPRLQGASDRDPRMQTSAERDSRQGTSRDQRSNDSSMYSNSSERDSARYQSSSDRDSRYYSSSERDREPRHHSSQERESLDSLERQRSYDRTSSSSDRNHRDHRSLERQFSSSERRDREHRSQTSSERDRYHGDRDRSHYSSSGRDRSRHSPDRDQRRRPPSPDRLQSERDPRRYLTSNRITSPAGGRSPSYSPSPLQSPVPSPVPPPAFGRPLPPLPSSGPPPSRDPRMAPAVASARPSASVPASNMEKQLFDGLKEALEEAKQDQSGEDVEQKYDELLNNLLESMPDEEEQILNALDRAFLVVFGRTARSRPNRGRLNPSTTPPTPQPPINIFQNIGSAAQPNVAPFQVLTHVQSFIIPQTGGNQSQREGDQDRNRR